MNTTTVIQWATAHPTPAAAIACTALLLTAAALWAVARALRSATRPQASVVVAAIAAAGCTAYGADTSWQFAAHRLGMESVTERAALFFVAELALFACALMARANLQKQGSPGAPGALVWVIVGVQIIPAYDVSGLVGGTVRAFIGSVLAGLMWHLAMGIELRHVQPGALSTSLLAQIGRELRERLLSRLGLATRDRTAEQITRDRATEKAVRLAAHRTTLKDGSRRARRTELRLAAAVARAGVGSDPAQRQRLMQLLAARRDAAALATVALPSPWEPAPEPVQPRTPAALVHQELTRMDPIDAIREVRLAHPGLGPAEIASLCIRYGLVVTETQVRIATGAGNPVPGRTPQAVPGVPDPPVPALDAVPDDRPGHPAVPDHQKPEAASEYDAGPVRTRPPVPAEYGPAGPQVRVPDTPAGLVLDLAPMEPLHAEARTRVPVLAAGQRRHAVHARVPVPGPDASDDPLLPEARALVRGGRLPTYRQLRALGIGQARAERIRAVLATEVRAVPAREG